MMAIMVIKKKENHKSGKGEGYHKNGKGGGYHKNGNGGGYQKKGNGGGYQKKGNGVYKKSKHENSQSKHTLASQKFSPKISGKKKGTNFATFDKKFIKKSSRKTLVKQESNDGVANDLEKMKQTLKRKNRYKGKADKKNISKRNVKSIEIIVDTKRVDSTFTFGSDYKNLEKNRKMSSSPKDSEADKKKEKTNGKKDHKKYPKPQKLKRKPSSQNSSQEKKRSNSRQSTSSNGSQKQKKRSESKRSTSKRSYDS